MAMLVPQALIKEMSDTLRDVVALFHAIDQVLDESLVEISLRLSGFGGILRNLAEEATLASNSDQSELSVEVFNTIVGVLAEVIPVLEHRLIGQDGEEVSSLMELVVRARFVTVCSV